MATDISFDIIARDKASSTFRRVGSTAGSASSHLGTLGKYAARATVALGGVATAASVFVFKVGSSYVDSLNKIQALTDSNNKTMEAAAKKLEANSGFYAKMGQTTGDAAAGVVELTKAGLSLNDSLKAVNSTMVLAKAGELSVADASSLVANSLNTFGLKAKDAGKLANELANAANISSADVSDLAESFKYVSPVASAAGLSIGETSAILAELANSGIKASSAGTTLRTFLLNLQAPAAAGAKVLGDLNVEIFDAQGNMKPLPEVIGQLSGALNDLPAKEKAADLKAIFGKTGIAGATTILNQGKDGLKQYEKGVDKAGAASKLAQARSKGLAGTFASIKSQVTSAAQEIYRKFSPDLNRRLKTFIQQFKDGKGAGGEFRDALKSIKDIAEELAPAMQKVAHWTGQFLGFLASHQKALAAFVAGLVALKGFKMANSFTGGSLSKTITGSLTGGVQKVFVVNMGAGGLGGGGAGGGPGVIGTAAKFVLPAAILYGAYKIGMAKGKAEEDEWKRHGATTLVGYAEALLREKMARAGMTQMPRTQTIEILGKKLTVPAVLPDIKAIGTHLDAVKQASSKASAAMDLIGPRAKTASAVATNALDTVARNGLDGVKQHAADASRNLDLIGPHTREATRTAITAIGGLNASLAGIKDKHIQITAQTSQAMDNLRVMKYQLDQLHDKTIIVRAIGGHVPGEPSGAGGGSGGGSSRGFRGMGRSIMDGITDGIADRKLSLQNALDKVAALVSRMKDKVSNLTGIKAGFRGTFSAENTFATDLSGGGGIEAIIAAKDTQAKQAAQLLADVKQAAKLGLSKSLIRQLRSQGTSGADALHAIVTGSPDRIALLNNLDRQTNASLAAAGIRAGNYVRGGSINDDIRRARKQEHVLEKLEDHLDDLAKTMKKGQTIIVEIDSEAIIRSIVRRNKRKGVKTAGV